MWTLLQNMSTKSQKKCPEYELLQKLKQLILRFCKKYILSFSSFSRINFRNSTLSLNTDSDPSSSLQIIGRSTINILADVTVWLISITFSFPTCIPTMLFVFLKIYKLTLILSSVNRKFLNIKYQTKNMQNFFDQRVVTEI